jgi:hypothetical protein
VWAEATDAAKAIVMVSAATARDALSEVDAKALRFKISSSFVRCLVCVLILAKSVRQGLKPISFRRPVMPGLKPWPISEATATARGLRRDNDKGQGGL